MKNILVVNGPNLNLLGSREPEIYGSLSLDSIQKLLEREAKILDCALSFYQSNLEGELVDRIQKSAEDKTNGVLLNAASYTHTSIALHDCIKAIKIPVVEVHISNIYQRESFRHHSAIASAVLGQISGFGAYSYILGLRALEHTLAG